MSEPYGHPDVIDGVAGRPVAYMKEDEMKGLSSERSLDDAVEAMQRKRLLVTGIGRSGTKYFAELLTAAGIPCGHEALYHCKTGAAEVPDWGDAVAESSWYATRCWTPDGITFVCHLVRHPMRWLSSWQTVWTPSDGVGSPASFVNVPSTRFISRCTALDWARRARRDPVSAAMALWVIWNQWAAQHANLTIRLEDEDGRVALLRQLGAVIKRPVDAETARRAIAAVPRTVNARKHDDVAWEDVRHLPLARALAAAADEYGYDIEADSHLLRDGAGI